MTITSEGFPRHAQRSTERGLDPPPNNKGSAPTSGPAPTTHARVSVGQGLDATGFREVSVPATPGCLAVAGCRKRSSDHAGYTRARRSRTRQVWEALPLGNGKDANPRLSTEQPSAS